MHHLGLDRKKGRQGKKSIPATSISSHFIQSFPGFLLFSGIFSYLFVGFCSTYTKTIMLLSTFSHQQIELPACLTCLWRLRLAQPRAYTYARPAGSPAAQIFRQQSIKASSFSQAAAVVSAMKLHAARASQGRKKKLIWI